MKHLKKKYKQSIIVAVVLAVVWLIDMKIWSVNCDCIGALVTALFAIISISTGFLAIKFAKRAETALNEIEELRKICSLERVTLNKN